ncbi:MAG: DMT family transporter [Rhodospirillaceae bacterium]|jgi:drug/metabolite transporter (DMT)-like permease|nr:DMT family transporter [Rhodospirillaceae bacterium]MBT3926535.1 DMT family transporter [Rhodospirillaceae bacterium]MBT4425741.1 DMT family transporter [Rhodospirillaceae bacterium]MBT5039481.1 DMT family transporter [Rhodospirillaceae bacterium]MBT5675750.1 DMT family transporter [Rhodospirillaceae bacterium]
MNNKNEAPKRNIGPLSVFLLIIAGLIYSLLFPVNRIATENGVPALGYVVWVSLGGGLILLIVCILRRKLPFTGRRHLLVYFIGGVIGLAAPMTLLTLAAPHLPSSVITMIVVLAPLLSYLFALPVKLERFRWLSVAGLLAGLSGILLILIPEASLPEPGMVGWVLLILLVPVLFALFNIFIDLYAPPESDGLQLGTGVLLAAGIIMLPITAIAGDFHLFPGPSAEGDFAVLYATLINVARWWLMFVIITMAGAVFVSQAAYIIVLGGFGWQALFFGGSVSGYIWAAAALLLLGLATNTLSKMRLQRAARPRYRNSI